MSQPNKQSSPNRFLLPIRLIEHNGKYLAAALADERSPDFDPFPLPGVPASLIDWLRIGSQTIWAHKNRCIAGLLLIHTRSHRWTIRLPHQRCGPDAAQWYTLREDLPALSARWRIGGSFQTKVLGEKESAEDCIPAAAGIHVVQPISYPLRPFLTFMRIGERVYKSPSDFIISNDWHEALQEAAERITLA
jgi:hypothetical protein